MVIPRKPTAVFTPPLPVRVMVPDPPAEIFAEVISTSPILKEPVLAPPPVPVRTTFPPLDLTQALAPSIFIP